MKDINIEIDEDKKDILQKIKSCGFENWAGEPSDARGDYTNYILGKFPDLLEEIKKNKFQFGSGKHASIEFFQNNKNNLNFIKNLRGVKDSIY